MAPTHVRATIGRVASLTRYPLRSAAGEVLVSVRCGTDGLVGDRTHVVLDAEGRPLRSRDHPGLGQFSARLVPAGAGAADGETERLEVRSADGRVLVGDDLARALGVQGATTASAAEHAAAPGGSAVAPLHLVSTGAEAGPGGQDCDPHPRANVVLDLDDQPPGAERGWTGADLVVGGARLRVTRTPRTCLGVYAEVVSAGDLAVGDVVELVRG